MLCRPGSRFEIVGSGLAVLFDELCGEARIFGTPLMKSEALALR